MYFIFVCFWVDILFNSLGKTNSKQQQQHFYNANRKILTVAVNSNLLLQKPKLIHFSPIFIFYTPDTHLKHYQTPDTSDVPSGYRYRALETDR